MSTEIFEGLKKSVLEYDPENAEQWAKKAVKEQVDPLEAVDALTVAIRGIGDSYSRGEIFLPELIGAAKAMETAMPVLQEEIRNQGKKEKSVGTVVIGTVVGDIHNLGKNMVVALLRAAGFKVYDQGVNVPVEKFITAIRKYNPQILAMSALLTTTIVAQKKVIEVLRKEGLRDKIKVMVGGSAITQEFAKDIGADGYEPTAPEAVNLAKRFVSSK